MSMFTQALVAIYRDMGIWDDFMLRPPGKYILGFGNCDSFHDCVSD